jgi:hypothetical protein
MGNRKQQTSPSIEVMWETLRQTAGQIVNQVLENLYSMLNQLLGRPPGIRHATN